MRSSAAAALASSPLAWGAWGLEGAGCHGAAGPGLSHTGPRTAAAFARARLVPRGVWHGGDSRAHRETQGLARGWVCRRCIISA